MPPTKDHPGVYVDETPTHPYPIAGASTSNTAFVGFFEEGPMREPARVTSFSEFEQVFGGLDSGSRSSYAVQQYFLNGGEVAFVVRADSCTEADNGLRAGRSQRLIDGVEALEEIAPEIFNILCIPDAPELRDDGKTVYDSAIQQCLGRRAFLLVDIPERVDTTSEMLTWQAQIGSGLGKNAAVYFPRLEVATRQDEGKPPNVPASGTIAGLFARTDADRGVWKAPAGTEATLHAARPVTSITDRENGELNPRGINAVRTFPSFGSVCWGARTLEGDDQKASEWKYVPVRRTALFIEESLDRGLDWVVFEPNDEPLWGQIRLSVGAFMHDLFRRGAFQGRTPGEAYFVKCDQETTTPDDVHGGIVNTLVGFAPLKPAEFVILKITKIQPGA